MNLLMMSLTDSMEPGALITQMLYMMLLLLRTATSLKTKRTAAVLLAKCSVSEEVEQTTSIALTVMYK